MDREQVSKDVEALLMQAEDARLTARLAVSLETKVELGRLAQRFEARADKAMEKLETNK